jgi:ribosome modulation factor
MAEVDEYDFSDGQQAFEDGLGQQACPHDEGSRAQRFWLAGWDEARRYAESWLLQGVGPAQVVIPFAGRRVTRERHRAAAEP